MGVTTMKPVSVWGSGSDSGSGSEVGAGMTVRSMGWVVVPPRSSVMVAVKESVPLNL